MKKPKKTHRRETTGTASKSVKNVKVGGEGVVSKLIVRDESLLDLLEKRRQEQPVLKRG